MSKICPNCRNPVPDENFFCATCGMNLAFIAPQKSTELLLGEKMYLGLLVFSLGLEAILFSRGSGEFMNPAYFVAPLLLGFFKQEPFVSFGNLSKPFKKYIWLLILASIILFIWESNPGDPFRDAILILLGPIIVLMILIMYFIVNVIFYSIGHVFYKIFR